MQGINFQEADWEPDEQVQDVLRELKPSNDACESILGLNDYLTTAIPNLHQMARSNLVQVKKTKHCNGYQTFRKMTSPQLLT